MYQSQRKQEEDSERDHLLSAERKTEWRKKGRQCVRGINGKVVRGKALQARSVLAVGVIVNGGAYV